MTVVVTGASGFVGRALCRRLTASGHRVIGVYREAPPNGTAMETRIIDDLTTVADFAPIVEGADAVVHLAARVHMMRETAADPDSAFLRANAEVTKNLAEAAVRAGIGRFVFLSSVKVNGEETGEAPFAEADDPAPDDSYARSKLAAEIALDRISSADGLAVTTLRIPLVYGPGVRANFAALLRLCDTALPLPLAGITSNRRSLLFLGNLTHAIERALGGPPHTSGTYLLSDGEDLSTADLVERLRRCLNRHACGIPVPVSVINAFAAAAGRRSAADRLCGSLQMDSSRFGRVFQWSPPFSVDQGLAATAAWHRAAG